MKKMIVLLVSLAFVVTAALPALPPLGIELGMPLSELNELFTEPQYYEQFTGNWFRIDLRALATTKTNFYFGDNENTWPVVFFRDGLVIGFCLDTGSLFQPIFRNSLDTSHNIFTTWNRYINELTEKFGDPDVTFPEFPIILPDNRVIRNFNALIWDEAPLGIEAVFQNGFHCRMQRMVGGLISIVFSWGEMPW